MNNTQECACTVTVSQIISIRTLGLYSQINKIYRQTDQPTLRSTLRPTDRPVNLTLGRYYP